MRIAFYPLLALPIFAPGLQAEPFRFHLLSESRTVDPQVASSANGNYIFHLIYSGLYTYSNSKGLKPTGADKCERSPLRLKCRISSGHKWSDGEPITARDYQAAFRRLVDPRTGSPHADMVFTLKNARAIAKGQKAPGDLGVGAPDSRTLIFEFAEEDPEFEYKLIHPAVSPLPRAGYPETKKSHTMPVSGPYKIMQWKSGSVIRFEPNLFFPTRAKRPPAEAWVIDDDGTALTMYESGKLSFLRRLPAMEIPRYRKSPEFHQIPQARFDYVGFGPDLIAKESLRAALILGVDFDSYLKVLLTITPPGCPGLPSIYADTRYCRKMNLIQAKAYAKNAEAAESLEFQFSRMGGEDIARAVEWFQGQWRKNLGINTRLEGREQAVYLAGLKAKPPAIFRKGVSLDRPTCMAGLEIFTKDHPENYIRFDDPEYERLVKEAGRAVGPGARKKACSAALRYLLDSNRIIPLGELYFTILAKSRFTGWELNELNQLNLSQLEEKTH